MTPENFVYWLQGYVELCGSREITHEQWVSIKQHLNLVLNKVTPGGLTYPNAPGLTFPNYPYTPGLFFPNQPVRPNKDSQFCTGTVAPPLTVLTC